MRNTLYFTGLAMLLVSCASKKPIQKVVPVAKTPVKTTNVTTNVKPAPAKPSIKHDVHGDYFTVNIADPTKNDNTISYGSIVSAKPVQYKIVRDYFPAVAQNFRQRFIILHYTALNDDKSLMVLTQQSVSAHYLVKALNDKDIYQLVDENKRAYHAGVSSWRGFTQLNDTSIGIEIVNESKDVPGGYLFQPFPEYQISKVAALVKDIANRYQIPATNILAHSDIAPTRKQDPGPMFPWKKLYTEYQIGMWYDDYTKQSFMSQLNPETFVTDSATPSFIYSYQKMLKDFGYAIDTSGEYNDATKKTITAFQYHFRPENYDGIMDMETYAILQALLQKYPSK